MASPELNVLRDVVERAVRLGAESIEVEYKDGFEETVFDGLGWSDRAWSKKVGMTSYKLMYHVLGSSLAAGNSCVIESNFSPEYDGPVIRSLLESNRARLIEIVCRCRPEVAFERFRTRAESGQRHPGHVDSENLEEFRQTLEGWTSQPLGLGETIELDTNDFATMDPSRIFAEIDRLTE